MDKSFSLSLEQKLELEKVIKSEDSNALRSKLDLISSEQNLPILKEYCLKLLYEIQLFEKSLECYKVLLQFTGYQGTYTNEQGRTLLHLAAFYGNLSIVETLLEMKGVEIDKRTPNGCTALYLATPRGHFKILNKLLCKGAEVNCVTNSGSSPLLVTAHYGYISCANLLLSYGADANHSNSNGMTSLHIAAELCHWDLYDLFLREGGDNKILNKNGETPDDIRTRKLNLQGKKDEKSRLAKKKMNIKLPGIKSREQSREPAKKTLSPVIASDENSFFPNKKQNVPISHVRSTSPEGKVIDSSSTRSSQSIQQVQPEHLYTQPIIFSR